MRIDGAGCVLTGILVAGLLSIGACQKGSSPGHEAHRSGPARSGGSGMSESGKTAVATFEVHGMHCNGCVNSIQQALAETEGVVEKSVSLEDSAAVVTYDPEKVTPADLVAVIEELGYTAAERK